MMLEEIRNRWTYSLRHGKNVQTRGKLRDDKNGRCCLGDLCDVVGFGWSRVSHTMAPDKKWGVAGSDNVSLLPPLQLTMVGLSDGAQQSFASLNDDDMLTFEQISDFVYAGWVPRVPDRHEYDDRGMHTEGPAYTSNKPEFVTNGILWYRV